MEEIKMRIEQAWENRSLLSESSTHEAITSVITALNEGQLRVAEPLSDGSWQVNEWVKKQWSCISLPIS